MCVPSHWFSSSCSLIVIVSRCLIISSSEVTVQQSLCSINGHLSETHRACLPAITSGGFASLSTGRWDMFMVYLLETDRPNQVVMQVSARFLLKDIVTEGKENPRDCKIQRIAASSRVTASPGRMCVQSRCSWNKYLPSGRKRIGTGNGMISTQITISCSGDLNFKKCVCR